jgi:CDP-glucose 4,6-dehydratase
MFSKVYKGTKVIVTGHTGFKGSWLCLWLQKLGAEVCGIALEPNTDPSHYKLLAPDIRSEFVDIRDYKSVKSIVESFQPAIIFHMAAQPLVRLSYETPLETFHTNVLGAVHILDACRQVESVRAIVNITSDKCYENKEWVWGYRENDPMGGFDPYSASKGCSELITNSFRQSFFPGETYGKDHQTLLASARAGNVIGGGDWGLDRLIPDIVKAIASNEPMKIRNPHATRPWQHVLEPLSGYLLLGQHLLEKNKDCAEAWNFGPTGTEAMSVTQVVDLFKSCWDVFAINIEMEDKPVHESHQLRLDCTKARSRLKWIPVWNTQTYMQKTVDWYRSFYQDQKVLTEEQLEEFIHEATEQGKAWAV